MSLVVQTAYNVYQDKGQPGQISKPSLQFVMDSNGYIAGEELRPGEGVYLDTGKYIMPTDLATQEMTVGVVSLVQNSINAASANGVNNQSEIVIALDEEFQIITEGHIYVVLSATVSRGDPAFPATDGSNTWVTATPTATVLNPAIFEDGGVSGDLVSIRLNGRIA